MNYNTKCLIIGSGAAGYTAGIYTARANLQPIIVSGNDIGGQLTTTSDIENYPGFEKINGLELMEKLKNQAIKCGAQMIQDTIVDVDFSKRPFHLKSIKNNYQADSIIIATGAQAKWLGLESEQKYKGFGVSACAVCDGPFFRNKVVAVVGGGNTAITEALYLATLTKKVFLIHRNNNFKAEQVLLDKVRENDKIEVITYTVVKDILGEEDTIGKFVNGIKLENVNNGQESTIKVDGIFIAIGHKPCTNLFVGKLKLTENQYIDVNPLTLQTSIEGIYACGDVKNEQHKQAIIAAGEGCVAALEIEKFLSKNKK